MNLSEAATKNCYVCAYRLLYDWFLRKNGSKMDKTHFGEMIVHPPMCLKMPHALHFMSSFYSEGP